MFWMVSYKELLKTELEKHSFMGAFFYLIFKIIIPIC